MSDTETELRPRQYAGKILNIPRRSWDRALARVPDRLRAQVVTHLEIYNDRFPGEGLERG